MHWALARLKQLEGTGGQSDRRITEDEYDRFLDDLNMAVNGGFLPVLSKS